MEVRTSIDCPKCNEPYWANEKKKKHWANARDLYNVKCNTCKEVYPTTGDPKRVPQVDEKHPFA